MTGASVLRMLPPRVAAAIILAGGAPASIFVCAVQVGTEASGGLVFSTPASSPQLPFGRTAGQAPAAALVAAGPREAFKGYVIDTRKDEKFTKAHHHKDNWQTWGGGVHFLRIQKTGGTTFGEVVLPEFCGDESEQCQGFSHRDFRSATAEGWTGRVVTLLRDPVERTLSEFSFIRSDEGKHLILDPQWDFEDEPAWRNDVVNDPDEEAALQRYLGQHTNNPSWNRQTLYLAGFKTRFNHADGGHLIWSEANSSALETAKANLDSLTAFGIADCYTTSMSVLAQQLGWDEPRVMSIVEAHHKRRQEQRQLLLLGMRQEQGQKWRDMVKPETLAKVLEINKLDSQLYEYAKERFRERFGTTCEPAY